jgi:Enoyl-CoA hydratase/isomerase family.
MEPIVLAKKEKKVAYLSMNRPEKLNALSPELVNDLISALKEAEQDPEVRVVVLSGEGSSFCAGGDISAFGEFANAAETVRWVKVATELEQTIAHLEKFVIGAVHGHAAGAGFSLALACDFIVADQEARFSSGFTKLALIPDLGLVKNLARSIPLPLAREWVATGKVLSAGELKKWGLVNRIAVADLPGEVEDFVRPLVEGPPLANQFVKYLFNHAKELTERTNFMQEVAIQSLLLQTDDLREGARALFEKRQPRFLGK